MFTLTILEILMFEGGLVLLPTQVGTGSERVKGNLEENDVIILGDFAENYSVVVQDEVLGFHWNNFQYILYPVVVYYNDGDALQSV